MTAVGFRRYLATDLPAVKRLHRAALLPTGADLGPGPWDDDLDAIEATYLESGGEFLVGTTGGEVVAMGALLPLGDGVVELKRMRVDPGLQGRGVGRELLARLEAAATERGFHTIRLNTTERQRAAERLYRAAGYRFVGREPLIHVAEAMRFEKPLSCE